MDCKPSRLLCPWDSPAKETGIGLPFPPPGHLPEPGIEPVFPALSGGFFTTEPPGKPQSSWTFTSKKIKSFLEFHFQICVLKSFYISLLPAAGLYTLVHGLDHLKNFKKLQVIGLTKFLGQSARGPGVYISIKLLADPNTLPGCRMVDLRDKTQAPSQVYQISPQYIITWCIYPCLFPSFSKSLSQVQLFATPWTVAPQAPLSMEFSW